MLAADGSAWFLEVAPVVAGSASTAGGNTKAGVLQPLMPTRVEREHADE
jgi:hypothetical protein